MAQTDERGVVTFTGLPGAPLDQDVIVRDPAGRVNVSRTLYGAHATSGQRSVRVVFPDARTLRGRVLLPDGSPSAGAFVRAHTESGSAQTIADSSGAFAIELNDGGRLPISVSASPLPPDRSKPLMGWDVAEDFTRELEIRLGPVPVYGAR
jgi:hypothetical protein